MDADNVNKKADIKDFLPPAGIKDILPLAHEYFTYIKKVVRHRCRQAGFRRITTPLIERRALIETSLGDGLNAVYHFEDPSGHPLTLKSEGLSGIVRAFIQHHMHTWPQPVELYFIEPHFRFEPDMKGHQCQFHQFGTVVLGEGDMALSAQVVYLGHKILQDLGLESLYHLHVNTVGCDECRSQYIEDLKNFYFGKERVLCSVCIASLEKNPLHLLNCQEEDCKILAELAPHISIYICKNCKNTHKEFLEYLDELGISYQEDQRLFPSLEYFNGSLFEYVDNDKDTVLSGGHLSGLVEKLGGEPNIPAVGFSMGIEKLINGMKREKIRVPSKDDVHVFVAQLGKEAKKKCLLLVDQLREEGMKTVGALGKGSMRIQIDLATKFKAPYMVIIGVTEVRDHTAIIRNMNIGQQKIVSQDELIPELIKLIGENNLDKYSPGEVLY